MDSNLTLSAKGHQTLDCYERYLRNEVDLSEGTIRGYVGDVRLFMIWCEQSWAAGQEPPQSFLPDGVATPTITRYRDYLQHGLGREPATINRYLTSLKRYFAWATETETIARDPSRAVKLVKETPHAPRHLSDQEEEALVAAVEAGRNLRDRTLIILMLHTGLRVSEVCHLKHEHITLGQRSGYLKVWGTRT
jgi:integrase/recombinase XerC